MDELDRRLTRVRQALRRLAPDQGRIARNNARRAVRSAVRGLVEQMDRTFPGSRKAPKRTGRLSATDRLKRWKREGYVPFPSNISDSDRAARMRDLAAARIEVKIARGTAWPWVPDWTLVVGVGEADKLKRMKRDPIYRKAEWTVAALKTLKKEDGNAD